MLSKLVVAAYQSLVEITLWVFLIIGGLVGAGVGKTMDHPFVGLIIGAVVVFLGMAMFLGAALLLSEIHKSLAEIQKKLNADNGDSKAPDQLGTKELQVYVEQLRQSYKEMDTEELLDRVKSGTLTEEARLVARGELETRGVA